MYAYLRLTITDTLCGLADGGHAANPLGKVTRTFWYRLPPHWVRAGRLVPDRRGQLLRVVYGPEWDCRRGDGAVILKLYEKVLSEAEVAERPWLSDRAVFFAWREGDIIEKVTPAKL